MPRQRNCATADALRQVLPLDEFHHQCGEISCLLEAVDRPDVRMVEGREHFGFALEACEAIGIAGHRGGQHLDRHRTLQIAVGRAIDLAHSAGADLLSDCVDAEAGARSEGQTPGSIEDRSCNPPSFAQAVPSYAAGDEAAFVMEQP